MPRGDRTGPLGMGSMSGRGAGNCQGAAAPGFNRSGQGLGWGGRCRGKAGGGFGWRNMFFATGLPGWARVAAPGTGSDYSAADPEQERVALKGRAEALGAELEQIKSRLNALESRKSDE